MPEPEEVLIDAAQRATITAQSLWRRRDGARKRAPGAWLDDHRDRLRLLSIAVFGREWPIRVAEPPAPPSFLSRLMRRLPRALVERRILPGTNGAHVFLPPHLPIDSPLPPARLYRVLMLQQAARAEWLTRAPEAFRFRQPLRQDLLLLRLALAADRRIARDLPGMAADLQRLRQAVLAQRPDPRLLTEQELAVETLYRERLQAPLRSVEIDAPEAIHAWVQATAAAIEARPGRYRGLLRDHWWGLLYPPGPRPAEVPAEAPEAAEDIAPSERRVGELRRRPEVREAEPDEDDASPGPWMVQNDDPHEHIEDPMGLQRPADRDDAKDPEDLADSLSDLPQARLVTTPEPAREVLVSEDAPDRTAIQAEGDRGAAGIVYPEWDCRIQAYRRPGATVRLCTARAGPSDWAEAAMERHRPLLLQVQRRFERLRPQRISLGRQPDGEDIDLEAVVDAHADLHGGGHLPERLYRTVRPARRDLAISLLVDISGSTDGWVSGNRRIIDVEKEALLIVCHALDVLGDPYTVQAFSGNGPEQVRVWPVKDFEDRDRLAVRGRIAGLEPDRYTRVGAALRHATAQLAARREGHRLLLLLSDGKPNDADQYEGRYGVEDLRQAVAEATLQGIHCFCLTVDRAAPGYLSAVFGPGRYSVLRHPGRLPVVLVDVLRELLVR